MNAIKRKRRCWRCDKAYEAYNEEHDKNAVNGVVTANIITKNSFYENDVINLCPDCCQEFSDWLARGYNKEEGGQT